jgi:hypothetical protein
MNAKQLLGGIFAVGLAVACSDDGGSGPDAGTGGTSTTGLAGAGGTIASTGGKSGSGGKASSGGTNGTGGKATTGGTSGDGGSTATGGSDGSGGGSATGGAGSGACVSGKKLAGKLVINEVFALSNNQQEPYDFIELYNVSGSCLDLSGLYFHDIFPVMGAKATVPNGTELAAGSYLVLTKGASFPFGLSNGGDGVALFAADGTLVDSTEWNHPDADVSWGRSPNGSGEFAALLEATPGKANAKPAPAK